MRDQLKLPLETRDTGLVRGVATSRCAEVEGFRCGDLASGERTPPIRPLLKWAGGKTQLLGNIMTRLPRTFGRYVEPFMGGGALYFALQPTNAVIADSNAELINLYKTVANECEQLIEALRPLQVSADEFYRIRAIDWQSLDSVSAAARMIYLNKTCFNGLYRVNKRGHFNVPFGQQTNPRIVDEEQLRAASRLLQTAEVINADFRHVLRTKPKPGDLVFLDPPYLPISAYSDFKRYTKEQFQVNDHIELAAEMRRLCDLGCTCILTNSNHELVHDLYRGFTIEVVQTKRYVSCNGAGRTGEDVIIHNGS